MAFPSSGPMKDNEGEPMREDEVAIRSSYRSLTVREKSHEVIGARESAQSGQDRWKLSLVVKILSNTKVRVAGL